MQPLSSLKEEIKKMRKNLISIKHPCGPVVQSTVDIFALSLGKICSLGFKIVTARK